MIIDEQTQKLLLKFQRNEITEYKIYRRLSKTAKGRNRAILSHIADDEKRHYAILFDITKKKARASKWQILKYIALSRIFGIVFAIKLAEKGEAFAQASYAKLKDKVPQMQALLADEHKHENELIALIHEERLDYMGSIVLGLNDALVELTGALAGLSFALQNTSLVALAGLVTGIAASMSMAASEYLSKKSENDENPVKSSVYTGIAYILTVILLVLPYLFLTSYAIALMLTLITGVLIIALFTYFNAVTKNMPFRRNFLEMVFLSFGVAIISFFVGIILRRVFEIEV